MSEISTATLEPAHEADTPDVLAFNILKALDRVMKNGSAMSFDSRDLLPRHLGYHHYGDSVHDEVYRIINETLEWAVADPVSGYIKNGNGEVAYGKNTLVAAEHCYEDGAPYAKTLWVLGPGQDPLY